MVVVTESSGRVVSEPTQLRRRRGIRLFHPAASKSLVIPHENVLAKLILDQHGRSTYDFFKVWPDKSYFFSESKSSFISYTVARGVVFVLGDPVGPDAEIVDIVSSFLKYCSRNRWLVCFLFPDRIGIYESIGLSVLKFGEEAVVDLGDFCRDTAQKKYFRYHRNRFERRGFSINRYLPPHPVELLREVEAISKEWLILPDHRELGFVQGRLTLDYIGQIPLFVVRDSVGLAIAFINEVPSYRIGEATFDMMRYRPGVPNGTMDYLLLGTMFILKQEGYQSFNLGIAPFAGLGKWPGASLMEKFLQVLYRTDWFISSRGIYYYKLKFEPRWNNRFICYQGGPLGLLRIGWAITKVLEGN